MKYLVLLACLVPHCYGEAPKVTVVQTTAVACAAWNSLIPGSCRPAVVVNVESSETAGKFLVGIRYLSTDGTEMIESRYPVSAGSVWFYLDDVTMLSATASSMRTNQVGIWQLQP